MIMNKKGSVQDLIFIGIVLLFFSMIVLIMFKVGSEFNTKIQANSAVIALDTGSYARTASSTTIGKYTTVLDKAYLFLAIGMGLVAIILSALVVVHPIFIFLFIFVWILTTIFSGVFSNIYQKMAENTSLAASASQLTFISLIMNYLPIFIAVIGIIMMVVMHKVRSNYE